MERRGLSSVESKVAFCASKRIHGRGFCCLSQVSLGLFSPPFYLLVFLLGSLPPLSHKLEDLWCPPLCPGKKSSSEAAAWSRQEAGSGQGEDGPLPRI